MEQLDSPSDPLRVLHNLAMAAVSGFPAGLPIITTTRPLNGPEFEYIEPGVNGFI